MSRKKKREAWSEVEDGLGSAGRIKILRFLSEHPDRQYTKYSLTCSTGLTSREMRRQVRMLVELGWVEEFPHEPRTYKIIVEDELVRQVADFFRNIRDYKRRTAFS